MIILLLYTYIEIRDSNHYVRSAMTNYTFKYPNVRVRLHNCYYIIKILIIFTVVAKTSILSIDNNIIYDLNDIADTSNTKYINVFIYIGTFVLTTILCLI